VSPRPLSPRARSLPGFLAVLLFLAPIPARCASANHVPGVPGWQQRVHYRIDAALDPAAHEVAGVETLTVWNESPDTLRELYWHLYLNAFQPGSNLALRAAANGDFEIERLSRSQQGSERIESAALLDGDTLRVEADDTVARTALPRALAPGESLSVRFSFVSRIPGYADRSGRQGRFYFVGQWYPKLAVYDRFGWHAEQHLGHEFYGDFGAFDVRIALPASYLLAYPGELRNESEVYPDSILERIHAPGDSAVTICDWRKARAPADSAAARARREPRVWIVHADSIHDFAWAACENWIWRRARWNGIEVDTYHRESDTPVWMDLASIGARLVEGMSTQFGSYPYPRFSFIAAPIRAGGMEYPGLTFITTRRYPAGSRRVEEICLHELAHNWFYGMLGSNETEQGFLDEGFTSYATTAVLERQHGRAGNMDRRPERWPWLVPPDDFRSRVWRSYLEYEARSPAEDPVDTPGDRFRTAGSYYPASYYKTEVGLWTLRHLAGSQVFDAALRRYVESWRFHHPYAEDFYASFDAATGSSWDWFFRSWFERTDAVDVGLTGLRSFPADRGAGALAASPGERADSFRVELSLRSKGGLDLPVEVALSGDGGARRTLTVPREAFVAAAGRARYRVTLPFEPKRAVLDPELALPDLSRSDNRIPRRPDLRFQVENFRSNPPPLAGTLVAWRPDLWYQAEDGVETGVAWDATTVRWQKGLRGLVLLGTRSRRAGADLAARFRSIALDPRSTLETRGYDLDGHRGLRLRWRRDLAGRGDPAPRLSIEMGADTDRLIRPEVPRRPEEWSRGGHGNLEVALSGARPASWGKLAGTITVRTSAFSDAVSYSSIVGTAVADVRPVRMLPLRLRWIGGRVEGSAIPPEERLYLAGAGPRGEWESRWFRSLGTIPTRWTAALGGDGNVRAFARERPAGTRLFALNVESRASRLFPLPGSPLSRVRIPVLEPRPSVFLDLGNVTGGERPLLRDLRIDAGVGIRTRALFRDRLVLRCDLPLLRTPPARGESRFRLRGVFSVGEAF